jgi:hypothetical protein
MTHEELLAKISDEIDNGQGIMAVAIIGDALRAVVELHKPQEITLPDGEWGANCVLCDGWYYPCPTIAAIEKALQ